MRCARIHRATHTAVRDQLHLIYTLSAAATMAQQSSIYDMNEAFRIARDLCGRSALDSFDGRHRLQKTAYLAQALGAAGGFTYSWCQRGPYSPSLAKMLHDARRVGQMDARPPLSDREVGIVNSLKDLLGPRIADMLALELYASVWYLLPRRRISQVDKERAVTAMANEKPHFGEDEVRECIKAILPFRDRAARRGG